MAKVKAGEGSCPACGERIVWRLADSGSLSCFCQDCDFQGYAKNGTQAKTLIIGKMSNLPPALPDKPNDPTAQIPTKVSAPPKVKAPGVFGLGGF